MVSVRQNLDLLVDNGQPVPGLDATDTTKWGATLGNAVYVWRSGLGVTADGALVYVGGPGLNITDLADLLVRAGAVRAMELDINTDWVTFATLRPVTADGAATPANGTDSAPGHGGNAGSVFRTMVGTRLHHHVGGRSGTDVRRGRFMFPSGRVRSLTSTVPASPRESGPARNAEEHSVTPTDLLDRPCCGSRLRPAPAPASPRHRGGGRHGGVVWSARWLPTPPWWPSGRAVFPSTKGYVHFQFSDYAKLTVIGVVVACVGWPVVTRISSAPRWLYLRLAVAGHRGPAPPRRLDPLHGEPGQGSRRADGMHLAIAVVTYNCMVRIARVRRLRSVKP